MKLRWINTISKEDIKKLDTHNYGPIVDAEFRDMKCNKCGYVVWQVDDHSDLYYVVFNAEKILSCDEAIIYQVLL